MTQEVISPCVISLSTRFSHLSGEQEQQAAIRLRSVKAINKIIWKLIMKGKNAITAICELTTRNSPSIFCMNNITAVREESMKLKLGDIATVQAGYSFRSRLETSARGSIAVIQMKDLGDDNIVNCQKMMFVDIDSVKEHHLVRKGDLIFRSRGLVTNSAIFFDGPGKSIVAAPLLRIRITVPDKVLPEYLNWYISQRDAQSYLTGMAGGTAQKMINKQAVEELEIVAPSLERQAAIVELATLAAEEQTLLNRLAKKRHQYVTAILTETIKGEHHK